MTLLAVDSARDSGQWNQPKQQQMTPPACLSWGSQPNQALCTAVVSMSVCSHGAQFFWPQALHL